MYLESLAVSHVSRVGSSSTAPHAYVSVSPSFSGSRFPLITTLPRSASGESAAGTPGACLSPGATGIGSCSRSPKVSWRMDASVSCCGSEQCISRDKTIGKGSEWSVVDVCTVGNAVSLIACTTLRKATGFVAVWPW